MEAGLAEWGDVIVKPSFGYRGDDVERITDLGKAKAIVEKLLEKYETLVCQPFYPTKYGEYRITVAGDVAPINMLKLPPTHTWRCKTLEGSSFERFDAPDDLMDIAFQATSVMGMTLAGLDILPNPERRVRDPRGQPDPRSSQHLRQGVPPAHPGRDLRLGGEDSYRGG